MRFFDTETCGLYGMPVLIQHAVDDGPVQIHDVWRSPIGETLDLIEQFCEETVCGFNLAFDWFQLVKCFTTFALYHDRSAYAEDVIHELAILEERARFSDICLKPKSACDIMLHARKGPYQSLMDRDDIVIRRVPTALAWQLAHELEQRIRFDDIYFAKATDKLAPKWKVYDIKKYDGTINPDFKDIKLKFKASGALKNLYRHAFGIKEQILTFRDVEVPRKYWPEELGYAPYALAVEPKARETKIWGKTWPAMIEHHIQHWGYNQDARKYAGDDVEYTRRLYIEKFESPEPGDDDSVLACMVAASRWRGFSINKEKLIALRERAKSKTQKFTSSTAAVKRYLEEVMDDVEKLVIRDSTKRVVLEEIAEHWVNEDGSKHKAAERAQIVLDSRMSKKEEEIYDKLLLAGRFHASFNIIGTLSNRMSGADGFNPQGVKHTLDVRDAFDLADRLLGFGLTGGDFKSFEVTIAAAVFKDPKIDEAIRSGKKVHVLMAMELFPGMTYDQVVATEGTKDDRYDKGKKGFFLLIYGGTANTFKMKLGIPTEIGEAAFARFQNKYQGVKAANKVIEEDFGCMTQPGGIGSAIYWHEPKQFVESFLGFKRYFTLEIHVARTLFHLAQNPIPSWKQLKIKVQRRDRVQSAGGAAQSALYSAAFGIAARMQRAAKNHKIQSPGAQITKATQRAIWDIQPSGITMWYVQPMNIHDELMCPTRKGYEQAVRDKVNESIERFKPYVPFLAIDWLDDIPSWAGKKGKPNVNGVRVATTAVA